MPGLESFSVCTAIGLGSIYLLQVSWFVAWLSLDEGRIADSRDGLVLCVVHTDHHPPQHSLGHRVVTTYSKLLSSAVFCSAVIISTLAMLGCGVWGAVTIRQKFDPVLLLPSDSYLRSWLDLHDQLYPDNGWGAQIFTSGFDYSDLHKFEELTFQLEQLQNNKTHIRGIYRKHKNFDFLKMLPNISFPTSYHLNSE